jgi:uncharacterized protein (DUF2384 family)
MNIRQAEEIAADAASQYPIWPELHSKAFGWADRKKHDRKVSPDLRKRAASVARRIWEAKGARS